MQFNIKAPKWQLVVLLIAIVIGVAFAVTALTLYLLDICGVIVFAVLTALGALLIVIAIIGIYIYSVERFTLKDGTYFYRKPFLKSAPVKVSEITRVELTANGYLFVIKFHGENDKVLLKFFDDGTAFKNGELKRSLEYYNIPNNIF